MTPLAILTVTGCLAVRADSDRITAGELAAAIPGLTAPAPEFPVALAPMPGVQRVFHVPELRRLALRLHWDVEPPADICVERAVTPPDPAKFLDAMRNVLPQATIHILEYSRQPLPAGDLEFPANGLRAGNGGALWTGSVRYAGARRFTVWARVQVTVTVSRVIAAVDLRAGEPIATEQVLAETREESPTTTRFLQSTDQATGKWPRIAIRAGAAIRAEMLEDPKDVVRGDTVRVEVRNGAARLDFDGRAESSGSVGESIPVLNPTSHRRFSARVEGKGRVSVAVSVLNSAVPKENP